MKNKNSYIFISVILLIILFGFFLRLSGINSLIFHQPDEALTLREVKRMLIAESLNPKQFWAPEGVFIYLLYFIAKIYLLFLKILIPGFNKFSLFLPNRLPNMYRLGRCLAVLFGTLTLPILYKIAKKVFEKRIALVAVAFLAVGFLHTIHSAIIRPDILATLLILVSIYFSIKIFEIGKIKYYIFSSFSIGMATAQKYPSILAIVPFLLAHILNEKTQVHTKYIFKRNTFILLVVVLGIIILTIGFMADIERTAKFVINHLSPDGEITLQTIHKLAYLQKVTIGFGLFLILFASFIWVARTIGDKIVRILTNRRFLVSLIFIFLGFFIFVPYFFFEIKRVILDIFHQTFTTEHLGHERLPGLYNFLWYINNPLKKEGGLIIEIFALVGIIASFFKGNNKKSLLILSFGIIYFLVISVAALRWERWIIPIIPILIIFAAYGLVLFIDALFKKHTLLLKNGFLTFVVIALMISPTHRIIQHNMLFSSKDTRLLASEWIENNIPSGKKIALEYLSAILQPDITYIKKEMFDSGEEFDIYLDYLKKNPPKASYKIFGLKMMEFPIYDYGNLLKAKAYSYDYNNLLNENVEYLVISSLVHDEYMKKPDRYIAQSKFYEEAKKNAQLIKEFNNDKLDTYGPNIKIYKIR